MAVTVPDEVPVSLRVRITEADLPSHRPGGVNRTFTYTGTGSEVAGIAAIEIA